MTKATIMNNRPFCKHIPAWEKKCLGLYLMDIEIHIVDLKYTKVTNVVINQLITGNIYLNMSKESWLLLIFSFSSLLKSQQSFMVLLFLSLTQIWFQSLPLLTMSSDPGGEKFLPLLEFYPRTTFECFFHFCICQFWRVEFSWERKPNCMKS